MTTPHRSTVRQQSRLSAWLLAGCCLALASIARATPTLVLESSLDNGNWFPVEREVMQEVVTDSAISQLSQDFEFLLVSANDPRAKTAEILRIDATLIEPAQDIKVVVKAVVDGQTRQAEVVTDIDTSDYSSIVQSLAQAGRSVATRMSAKLTPDQGSGEPTDEKLIETQRLLNQAAQLKREGKYEQSHAALRLILSQKDLPDEVRESVKEELHFRLPIYQADELMQGDELNQASGRDQPTPEEVRAHYDFIESILQKALDQNLEEPERQRQLNQRLDTLYRVRKVRLKSMQHNARMRVVPLKTDLAQHMSMHGSVSEKQFRQLVDRNPRTKLRVHEFESSGNRMKALVETENEYRFHVRYSRRDGVTIKAAEQD